MKVNEIASQIRDRIPVSAIRVEDYVSTDNMRPNFGGIEKSLILPPSGTVTAFQTDDILLSNIRPYFRKTWLATHSGGCNADVLCIRANPNKCIPKYLYYLFTTDNFVIDYLKSCKGAKMPRGDVQRLLDYEFDLPDQPTQLRIAGILGSIDEKIELNRKKIAELEALAGVVYNQLVATNQCEYSTISAVATVKTGKQDSNFSTADGEYRFFTCSKDILWCDKYEFEGKAILLTGNGDLHVRYFDGKFNAYQRTYVLQPNDARFFSAIYFAVRAMLIRLARSASGSIVKFITKGDVEHIKVPAFKEQHQKLLNDCLSNVLNIEQEIDALIRIRDKLLPLLMNGQVAVK